MLFSIEIKQGLIPVSGRHSEGLSPKTAETGIKQYRSISHNNRFAWLVFICFHFLFGRFSNGLLLQVVSFCRRTDFSFKRKSLSSPVHCKPFFVIWFTMNSSI